MFLHCIATILGVLASQHQVDRSVYLGASRKQGTMNWTAKNWRTTFHQQMELVEFLIVTTHNFINLHRFVFFGLEFLFTNIKKVLCS
mmetsp:Transcript_9820/g.13837  ORF Transcript_9820/g.13837 Transcript_9820/m.13837 type:complete len:87 (-) Transcript_9820:180-440(-)